jgi:hypothetical protein
MDRGDNAGLIMFVWLLSAIAIVGLIVAYAVIPG